MVVLGVLGVGMVLLLDGKEHAEPLHRDCDGRQLDSGVGELDGSGRLGALAWSIFGEVDAVVLEGDLISVYPLHGPMLDGVVI